MRIKTAIISVSEKKGIVEFSRELVKNGVKIISSGGTHKLLQSNGIESVSVERITGFPEMLDGRIKTLHPKLHAGILAKRTKPHLDQLKEHKIETIDLVVVNLYPFQETISKKEAKLEEAIENIDIGGPALIRAAAKNYENVGIIVDQSQYEKVLDDLKKNKFSLSENMRKELCAQAFSHTAFYDSLISQYLSDKFLREKFPKKFTIPFEKVSDLRYGENPHQQAALYKKPQRTSALIDAKQLGGKEMSFNNYIDAQAALLIVKDFEEPCAAIIKHTNPSGVAIAENISEALTKALLCDKTSAFGGIIALNRKCDHETAKKITSFFNEVVIAPGYEEVALRELKEKKNLRILQVSAILKEKPGLEMRQIEGGALMQEKDISDQKDWKNVSGVKVNKVTLDDLKFAWKIVKHVKSNAIVIVKKSATIGIGGGLSSRIDATELAIKKAGKDSKESVLASDAFFPFKDSIDLAAKAGITAIAEPGGSLKDEEVILEAKKQQIALFFTGSRHFKH